jgi:hypothetical protein
MSGPFSYQVVTDWSFREKNPLEELQERGEGKKKQFMHAGTEKPKVASGK